MPNYTVAEIPISTLSKAAVLQKSAEFLDSNSLHTICTPNPEMLVKASTDQLFKNVLANADINLCDGFGLWLAAAGRCERIAGVDFMQALCALAEHRGERVFLLGSGREAVVEKARVKLKQTYPRLNIVGINTGPHITEAADGTLVIDAAENQSVLDAINGAAPSLLFVAFGMGKQEKWVAHYGKFLPSIRLAMGVGGAFDYISGFVPRAPRLLRKIGLEWMYRLVKQPQRAGRIFNATVRFGFLLATKQNNS